MASPYYSLVPRSQKPYATPWYQRTYVTNPISIEEELESVITQLISENDISSVPSGDAIYKYLFQRLKNIVTSNTSNIFTDANTFEKPIINEDFIDFNTSSNINFIPNVKSIKEYVSQLISGEIPDLSNYINSLLNSAFSNSYTYISSNAYQTHIINHNLNSTYLLYNIFVFDSNTGMFKVELASVSEIDSNTLVVELTSSQIVKVVVNKIISGLENTFTYTSQVPSISHMLPHNLNSDFIHFNVMVYDNLLQIYRNDLVSIIEIDSNILLVETNDPVNIKAAIAVF